MNTKQLLILLGACVLLGAVGLVIRSKQQSAWRDTPAGRERLIPDFPINDVAHITIKQATGEVNLVRTPENWVVRERADFAANSSEIIELLRKLWEMKPGQLQEISSNQLGRLELLNPAKGGNNTGTLVEFKDKSGKKLTQLMLGKKHVKKSPDSDMFGGGEFPDGRFVMVNDDVKNVSLVSETFNNMEPKPEQWINKEFIRIEKPRTISVTFTNATNSWKITRETETGEWKLADAKADEQLDNVKATSAGSAMTSPGLNDVVPPGTKPETTGLDHPTVIEIETFEHLNYRLQFGKKSADDNSYYMAVAVAFNPPKERTPGKDEKKEDKERLDKEWKDNIKKFEEKYQKEKAFEKWQYLVSKWSVESILKPRSEMLAPKKEEPKKEEPRNEEKKS